MLSHGGSERRHFLGVVVMGLLSKVVSSAKAASAKKKPEGTVWSLPAEMHGDAAQVVDCGSKIKALEATAKPIRVRLTEWASRQYVKHFCNNGVAPESSMKISAGSTVLTFVQQRRAGAVDDNTIEVMRDVIGDVVDDMVYAETTISFNTAILNLPGMMPLFEKHLDAAVKAALKAGLASAEQLDELLSAETTRTWRPDIQAKAHQLCGGDEQKMVEFFDALGSSCTRYVKA